MGSPSKTTKGKRRNRKSKLGRDAKKARAKDSTPKFPIHPEKKKS